MNHAQAAITIRRHMAELEKMAQEHEAIAAREIIGTIQCATGCGKEVPVIRADEGFDHICNQCDNHL